MSPDEEDIVALVQSIFSMFSALGAIFMIFALLAFKDVKKPKTSYSMGLGMLLLFQIDLNYLSTLVLMQLKCQLYLLYFLISSFESPSNLQVGAICDNVQHFLVLVS